MPTASVAAGAKAFAGDYGRLAWVAVGVGSILFLAHYLAGRSLWLDEAMLALNIKLLSFRELAGKLEYEQLAPVGWLYLEKAAYMATGSLEYGLRLIPVGSAIVALVAFRALAMRAIGGFGGLAATIAFAVSPAMLRYAAEVKPYGSDVLLAVLIIWASYALVAEEKPPVRRYLVFALVGLATAVLSFPGIYVLASCGLVVFMTRVLRRRWAAAGATGAIGALWLGLFLYLFLEVYSPQLRGSSLVQGGSAAFFNRTSYAPLPPHSLGDVVWYAEWAKDYLTFLFRPEGLYPATLLILLGAWQLLRRHWLLLAMALGPVVIGLIGSGLKLYPLYERLTLFAAPGMWLLVGAGAAVVVAASRGSRLGAGLIVGLIVAGTASYTFGNLVKTRPSFALHEIRPALQRLAREARPGDVFYVANNAIPAYLLYSSEYGLSGHPWIEGRSPDTHWHCFMQEIPPADHPQRIWVVFTFNGLEKERDKPLETYLRNNGRVGTITEVAQSHQAYLYRVDTTPLAGWDPATRPSYPCMLNEEVNRFDAPARFHERFAVRSSAVHTTP